MAGILDGLKVVSMEHMEAIPAASVWLADWGAEVIKVEPLQGEMWRGTKMVQGSPIWVQLENGSVNWGFQLLNRNKRGLALNLKTDTGRDILYKLVQRADVFMSNYELGALKNLKADYDSLRRINPGLIYAFLSGYGTVGPDKDERGYDIAAAWARAGFQYMVGEPGSIPPKQRGGMMDRTVAPHVVAGVCAALLHREKTGEGQMLQISLYHSSVWTLALDIESNLVGKSLPRDNRASAQNPLWNDYRTKDDRWFILAMLQSDLFWTDFCKAIEKPELEKDPRFDNMQTRADNRVELIRILDEILASKTIDEWDKIFRKYNLIYARIQSPAEVVADPQAFANNFFTDLNHPAGQMKVINTPVKFIQNPASVRSPAPEVGQHNEEILLDLGYSWEDIASIKEQGVIM
jgi:crotonobetainyl-CoA:carnitine CoA-transferase CaiB-like acyl-CoA transferase